MDDEVAAVSQDDCTKHLGLFPREGGRSFALTFGLLRDGKIGNCLSLKSKCYGGPVLVFRDQSS